MTDELAERIAKALEDIAFSLGDDGALGTLIEHLAAISDMLDSAAPDDGRQGRRYLRTLDIGRN